MMSIKAIEEKLARVEEQMNGFEKARADLQKELADAKFCRHERAMIPVLRNIAQQLENLIAGQGDGRAWVSDVQYGEPGRVRLAGDFGAAVLTLPRCEVP